jgi:hypothetical protein
MKSIIPEAFAAPEWIILRAHDNMCVSTLEVKVIPP